MKVLERALPDETTTSRRDVALLGLICAMGLVTAGYPTYVAHEITLLAPIPLLVCLLLLTDARLTAPVWLIFVGVLEGWVVLSHLAMGGSATSLIHTLGTFAPFAVLAFRIRRPDRVAIHFAVVTVAMLELRVTGSFLRAGGHWRPWQVYEGNDLAARLNVLLPLVLVERLRPPRRRSTGAVLVMLLGVGVLSLCMVQSRAGIGLLLGMVLVGLARTSWRALAFVGAAALTVWFLASEAILSLLERTRFIDSVASAPRQEIWKVAFDAMGKSPLLGVGPGNGDEALSQIPAPHAHNSFVQTALELGWPGAILIAGLLGYILYLAARLLWQGGRVTLWGLSLLAYLGVSFVSSPIVRPDFTLALVLVMLASRDHELGRT